MVDYFVANQPEIEECYNLAPVIKNLRNNADLLNAFLLIMRTKNCFNFTPFWTRSTPSREFGRFFALKNRELSLN